MHGVGKTLLCSSRYFSGVELCSIIRTEFRPCERELQQQSRTGTIFAIFQVVPSSQLRYIYILPQVGDNAYIRTSFTYGMCLKRQGLQVLTNTGWARLCCSVASEYYWWSKYYSIVSFSALFGASRTNRCALVRKASSLSLFLLYARYERGLLFCMRLMRTAGCQWSRWQKSFAERVCCL